MTTTQNLHPAERMVMLRETLGLSQREMAKEFHVTSGAISLWETGTRPIPGPILKLIELYEKALPTTDKGHSAPKTESLLKEIRSSLNVKDCPEAQEALNQIKSGVQAYFDDSTSMNNLNGKLKLILVQRLLKSLRNSKGVSVKIAQLASFLEMGLPLEVRNALGTLQSRSQPSKPGAVIELIEEEYGKPLKEIFSYWQEKPIAVTSIGQVHYAKLRSGEEVAVKVQHPEIREILQKQFRNIELLKTLGSFFGKDDNGIVEELKRVLLQECDYHFEATTQDKFRNIWSEESGVIVPYVYRDLVRERVMVTEYIKGESFHSFVARATQSQRNAVAETLFDCLTKAAFGYGLTYTDQHPDNFLFADGKVVVMDFGRVIEYPVDRLKLECHFYLLMMNKDYEKCRDLAAKLFAKDEHDFDFDAFWNFLQKSHHHLMVDEKFKVSREYVQTITREGRIFSKKHQLKMSKEAFWAYVFGASSWGILAALEAETNFRRIALRNTNLGTQL
ncbi:AarF/UbiB family protein [Bdellovibrio sp. HCB337]|uniref:AarF/UbiB family protein n=1 Tax=Bdellovibrio sp. HCB337 TaxID=3394358 RepID=UPI0039A565F8